MRIRDPRMGEEERNLLDLWVEIVRDRIVRWRGGSLLGKMFEWEGWPRKC